MRPPPHHAGGNPKQRYTCRQQRLLALYTACIMLKTIPTIAAYPEKPRAFAGRPEYITPLKPRPDHDTGNPRNNRTSYRLVCSLHRSLRSAETVGGDAEVLDEVGEVSPVLPSVERLRRAARPRGRKAKGGGDRGSRGNRH